jgi:hypothetical protein
MAVGRGGGSGGNADPAPAPARENGSLKLGCSLDEQNWGFWRLHFINLMIDENLMVETEPVAGDGGAEGPITYTLINSSRAVRALLLNISEPVIKALFTKPTKAQDMWNALVKRFAGKSTPRKLVALKRLAKFQCDQGNMESNINAIEATVNSFVAANGSEIINARELGASILLNSLPDQYVSVRVAMNNKEVLDMEELKLRILAEEESLNARGDMAAGQPAMAMVANGPQPSQTCTHGRPAEHCWTCHPEKHPRHATCRDCQSKGHFSARFPHCKHHVPPRASKRHAPGDGARANYTSSMPPPPMPHLPGQGGMHGYSVRVGAVAPSSAVIIDSGATHTLVCCKDQLVKYQPMPASTITIADGGKMRCPGVGTLEVNDKIHITNAMHCPDATVNLLSVAQLCDSGLKLTFGPKECTITRGGEIVAKAPRKGNLYQLGGAGAEAQALSAKADGVLTQLAHRRLGHLSNKALQALAGLSTGLELDGPPQDPCEVCLQAKGTRASFPASERRAQRVGELVHSDVCEVGAHALMGAQNAFVTFLDDHSRHLTVIPIKLKTEVVPAFIKYAGRVKNLTGRAISSLMTDNGTEYQGPTMTVYLEEHGIAHVTNTAYTPEQNGRAERVNRSILEGTRAMLIDQALPMSFWAWAACTYAYLKNRSPHHALPNTTPHQLLTGAAPALHHLRVFGTRAHVTIPGHKRRKLEPSAAPLIFIGYPEGDKGYLFLDPVARKIIKSVHAKFDDELSSKVDFFSLLAYGPTARLRAQR